MGITSVRDITEDVLVDYVSNREYRQVEYIRSVKCFVQFLHRENPM